VVGAGFLDVRLQSWEGKRSAADFENLFAEEVRSIEVLARLDAVE
jgi:hypothetical protein